MRRPVVVFTAYRSYGGYEFLLTAHAPVIGASSTDWWFVVDYKNENRPDTNRNKTMALTSPLTIEKLVELRKWVGEVLNYDFYARELYNDFLLQLQDIKQVDLATIDDSIIEMPLDGPHNALYNEEEPSN